MTVEAIVSIALGGFALYNLLWSIAEIWERWE